MGAWAFILCTGHRWCKTKEQQPWNNTKQIFPGQKTRKSFALRHLCLLHEVLSGIWSPLIVNSFGQGKCTISKTIPLATMSQQAHACWELRNNDLYVDNSYKFTLACMGICFSCVYTNKCEHFHKWFGTFYRNTSVLMRVPHIH